MNQPKFKVGDIVCFKSVLKYPAQHRPVYIVKKIVHPDILIPIPGHDTVNYKVGLYRVGWPGPQKQWEFVHESSLAIAPVPEGPSRFRSLDAAWIEL